MLIFASRPTRSCTSLLVCGVAVVCGCGGSGGVPVADIGVAADLATDLAPPPVDTEIDTEIVSVDVVEDGIDPTVSCAAPGAWGCDCETNDDCSSGWCVAHPDGAQCSQPCPVECPDGWACRGTDPEDPSAMEICVPLHANLCRPCTGDEACTQTGDAGGRCLIRDDGSGGFCGAACDTENPCPEGYDCTEVDAGGAASHQCVPADDAPCTCNALAIDDAASTVCEIANGHGTCEGSRVCGPEGLSTCEGMEAEDEVCDGVDNDCSGVADDGIPPLYCGIGVCAAIVAACVDGAGNVCEPLFEPGELEEICDGLDNDCDGKTDEELGSVTCGVGLCKTFAPSCAKGEPNTCEPMFQPGEIAESCNGVDDDCDGEVDEDFGGPGCS